MRLVVGVEGRDRDTGVARPLVSAGLIAESAYIGIREYGTFNTAEQWQVVLLLDRPLRARDRLESESRPVGYQVVCAGFGERAQ